MKKLMFATAALALGVGAASAQSVKATVPFEFQAAGESMPAGAYLLKKVTMTGDFGIWEVRSLDTLKQVFVHAPAQMFPKTAAERESKLVFHCVEQDCELSQIWRGGEVPGYKIAPGKRLKEQTAGVRIAVVRAE